MPQLIGSITDITEKPASGAYTASDIGKIELKEEMVVIEVTLTDEVDTGTTTRTLDGPAANTATASGRAVQLSPSPVPAPPIVQETSPGKTFSGQLLDVFPDDIYKTPTINPEGNTLDYIPDPSGPVGNSLPPRPVVDTSCTIPKQPEVEPPPEAGTIFPPDKLPPQDPLPPRGKNFYDPECDTCCHSPTDSPAQFYTLCLLVSTDENITKMVERGMIDQVYSSIPALQNKFMSGQPGAYLQETSFLDFTRQKINALVNSNLFARPKDMINLEPMLNTAVSLPIYKTEIQSYQFRNNYSFPIPPRCQHLTLFTFIRLDPVALNSYYEIPNRSPLPVGIYTGPIKEVSVIVNSNLQTMASALVDPSAPNVPFLGPSQKTSDGKYFTYHPTKRTKPRRLVNIKLPVGNIRSDRVFNQLLKMCSVSITQALQDAQKLTDRQIQNSFWISKNTDNTNTLFMMYNQEQLLMNNCLITNMKSKTIYTDQAFESVDIEKVDLLDESNDEIINTTTGISTSAGSRVRSNTSYISKILPDQESLDTNGAPVVVSSLVELPSISKGIKFLQVSDKTQSSGRYAYKATFTFKDPTITYLLDVTKDYSSKILRLEEVYSKIEALHGDLRDGKISANKIYGDALTASKNVIARAVSILKILPNKEFNVSIFTNYLTALANPKANPDDHTNLIKILKTLLETLLGILDNAGINTTSISGVKSGTNNARNSMNKDKVFKKVVIESQEFSSFKDTGIDFLTMTSEEQTKVVYDTKFISRRADAEYSKFWDTSASPSVTVNETLLREKSTFNLTPSKVYGVDETLDFSFERTYGQDFKTKVKKSKLAKQGKPTKSNSFYTVSDSLDGLPVSFQIVSNDFSFETDEISEAINDISLADTLLKNQDNFISGDIDTISNKTKQTTDYNQKSDKVLFAIENTFVEGFGKVGQGTTQDTINSNLKLEEAVDSRNLNELPPSLQSYKLRSNPVSRLSTFVTDNGLLSDPSNQIYLNNFFGVVAKMQYADISPSNLNSIEWKDLDNSTLQRSGAIFCRLMPISDLTVSLGTEQDYDIYNQYFVIENRPSRKNAILNPNNIRQPRSTTQQNLSNTENILGDRIRSIMEQNTTYNTGVPVSYTKIIY